MPGCVLRAAGKDFQVDDFLKTSSFEPCNIYYKGEKRSPRDRVEQTSGMTIDVSRADGDFARQIQDAVAFLRNNRKELEQLRSYPGVENVRLDFGISRRDVFVQCDFFPPELVKLAGALYVGIELSVYPRPNSS